MVTAMAMDTAVTVMAGMENTAGMGDMGNTEVSLPDVTRMKRKRKSKRIVEQI